MFAETAGVDFTPHVITVQTGEVNDTCLYSMSCFLLLLKVLIWEMFGVTELFLLYDHSFAGCCGQNLFNWPKGASRSLCALR